MTYDRLWERLIEYLDEWASARALARGIEVTFEQSPGVTRTVEVVVSPAEWDDYISTIYGTGNPGATALTQKLLAMPQGADYLVYDTYDWQPSQTRELPGDVLDPGPGGWVVTDEDGNVVDRFANFDERS